MVHTGRIIASYSNYKTSVYLDFLSEYATANAIKTVAVQCTKGRKSWRWRLQTWFETRKTVGNESQVKTERNLLPRCRGAAQLSSMTIVDWFKQPTLIRYRHPSLTAEWWTPRLGHRSTTFWSSSAESHYLFTMSLSTNYQTTVTLGRYVPCTNEISALGFTARLWFA